MKRMPPPLHSPAPAPAPTPTPPPGLNRTTVIDRVLRHGARPIFPPAAPAAYVDLATACWSTSPADRPSFTEISDRLRDLSDALTRSKSADGGQGVAGTLVSAESLRLPSSM